LHGNESPEFCNQLKAVPVKIIKVFSIDATFNFDSLKPYESVCDYYLFDTKGKLPGGNGVAFNWEILKKYPSEKPFFLSGGIGIESLENLKKLKLPIHAIDVNSKFENQPGYKNIQNLKAFQTHLNEVS
jgi:phosphoribosylanthranilate isomerase